MPSYGSLNPTMSNSTGRDLDDVEELRLGGHLLCVDSVCVDRRRRSPRNTLQVNGEDRAIRSVRDSPPRPDTHQEMI